MRAGRRFYWVLPFCGTNEERPAMTPIIPGTFAHIAPHVKRLYREDETFRETYDDYLTYCKAYRFWTQSRSEEAPARQREYADLVRELEDELTQILKSSSPLKAVNGE
jgi:hypothetical protein